MDTTEPSVPHEDPELCLKPKQASDLPQAGTEIVEVEKRGLEWQVGWERKVFRVDG